MTEVKRAVKRFKKLLHRKPLSFETVADVARIKGYSISFYDDETENPLLKKLDLETFANTVSAFTCRTKGEKYIFVDSEATPQNKLYSLVHEIGHILLKHLDTNRLTADKRWQEMQAEAFAYAVITSCKRKY